MMKKLIYLPLLLVAYLTLTSSSCKHNGKDDNPAPGNPDNSTPGSNWVVSLFTEPGENKTSDYNGYTFDFAADGSMKAIHGSETTVGAWHVHQDDGVTKFFIALNSTDHDLQELNDDWVLISRTASLISLQDDNSSKDEKLQFSK